MLIEAQGAVQRLQDAVVDPVRVAPGAAGREDRDHAVADGFFSWGFAWGVVLLCVTAVVGVLAFVRARQLRRLR